MASILQQDDEHVSGKLKELIESGYDIHSRLVLHWACERGNERLVEALLEYGAEQDILTGDKDGDNAIHLAGLSGKPIILNKLFEALSVKLHGSVAAAVNSVNKWQQTPLHYAVGKGDVEVARYLIDKGARVSAADQTGATALHFAARSGETKILELLVVEKGVADLNQANKAGLTALHYAAWNGKVEAVKWLVLKGADFRKTDKVEGAMPLHWAAMRGPGATEALLELVKAHVGDARLEKQSNGNLFATNNSGKNVLQLLPEGLRPEVLKGMIELLDDEFPGRELVESVLTYGDSETNKKLANSLECAGYQKEMELCRSLVEMQEWTNSDNEAWVPPILRLVKKHFNQKRQRAWLESATKKALLRGHRKVAGALVEQGCMESEGWLPRVIKSMKPLLVTKTTSEELWNRLPEEFKDEVKRQKKASSNFCCISRLMEEVPFGYLVLHTDREVIVDFIDKYDLWEELVNETGPSTGLTSLHWAVILHKSSAISKLCKVSECKTNVKDARGKTAFRYAVELGYEEIQRLLATESDSVRSYLEIKYRDRQVFVDASNAILVGAALIASITFAGFLQPPQGYITGITNPPGVQAFWIFNSLSFFSSMATALIGARGVIPMPDRHIGDVVKYIHRTLLIAASTLVFSIAFVLLAFGAAGFSVLPKSTAFHANMIAGTGFGGLICLFTLGWFVKGVYSLRPSEGGRHSSSAIFDKIKMKKRKWRRAVHHKCDEQLGYCAVFNDGGDENEEEFSYCFEPTSYAVGYAYAEYPWDDGLDNVGQRAATVEIISRP